MLRSFLSMLRTKNFAPMWFPFDWMAVMAGEIHISPIQICLPSGKLTQQWKIPILNRKYIFKGSIFHCYVRLLESKSDFLCTCSLLWLIKMSNFHSAMSPWGCIRLISCHPPKLLEHVTKGPLPCRHSFANNENLRCKSHGKIANVELFINIIPTITCILSP